MAYNVSIYKVNDGLYVSIYKYEVSKKGHQVLIHHAHGADGLGSLGTGSSIFTSCETSAMRLKLTA